MILVDFDMLAHRCYNAMDGILSTGDKPTGMEYGTMRTLKTLAKRISFTEPKLVLCLEGVFGKKNSGERPPWYKANREPKPPSFYERKDILIENLTQVYHWAEAPFYEADQVMHSLLRGDKPFYIYSNDSDLFQSISENVVVIRSFEHQLYFWDREKVFEKFLVWPYMYPIYKTLIGDPTDNIPGIKRIPRKLAAEMSRQIMNECVRKKGMSVINGTIQVMAEYYHRVSKNMKKKFDDFINKGQLQINYELIKLKNDVKVELQKPKGGSIQSYLDSLAIQSLTFEEETEF